MYSLILMACIQLNCEYVEVLSLYPTLDKCEAEMVKRYDDLENGQALLCVRKEEDIIA